MKCLHCGYCCKWLWVPIIADPEKGIIEDNVKVHMGNGNPCQHLRGNKPGEYSCAVHAEPWYKETPCASHAQIEDSPDHPCRMGVYQLKLHEDAS